MLDAPAGAFRGLTTKLLHVITNPALRLARLAPEKGVVESERQLVGPHGLVWLIDQFMFPGAQAGATIIGSAATRTAVDVDDLIDFYGEYYIPANTTIIVTGDFELEEIRTMIAGESRLAPSRAEESAGKEAKLELPIRNQARAPLTMMIVGYQLAERDRARCEDLARVIELRARGALRGAAGLGSEIEVFCLAMRGHEFLFATAASRNVEGTAIHAVETAIEQLGSQPLSAAELGVLQERMKRELRALESDPAKLADALVAIAQRPRRARGELDFAIVLGAPAIDARAVGEAAARNLRPERKFELVISPF